MNLLRPPRPDRRARGRSTPRRRGLLALVIGVWCWSWFAPDAGAQETTPFEIVIDRQQALFQLSGLIPGPVGSRCLAVEVRNGSADAVVVSALVEDLGLAPYLSLTVEAGDATDPTTCAGFTGTQQFSGTLVDLDARHGDPTRGMSIPMIDQRRVVLRFSLEVADDNAAQGKAASIRFDFTAQDLAEDPPPTTVPATTVPEAAVPSTIAPTPPSTTVPLTTVPLTTVPETTVPETTVTESTSTTAAATPRSTASGSGRPGGSSSVPDSTTPPAVVVIEPVPAAEATFSSRAAAAAREAVKVVTEAAGVTARTSVVPGAFSALVLGFLLLQARFDRNDPKLAAAPLEPDADLEFVPRHQGLAS